MPRITVTGTEKFIPPSNQRVASIEHAATCMLIEAKVRLAVVEVVKTIDKLTVSLSDVMMIVQIFHHLSKGTPDLLFEIQPPEVQASAQEHMVRNAAMVDETVVHVRLWLGHYELDAPVCDIECGGSGMRLKSDGSEDFRWGYPSPPTV